MDTVCERNNVLKLNNIVLQTNSTNNNIQIIINGNGNHRAIGVAHEFGHIVAWEKEDIVESGKPNAAGWLLPNAHSIHRRYLEVAILIPDTVGRACGGLCASCQRMYDFQSGNLNFELKKLEFKI